MAQTSDRDTSKAALASAVIAAVGLVITSFISWGALSTAKESLALSRDSLALSQASVEKELAKRFYLGESPTELQTLGATTLAAINANPVDIYDVWVDGEVGGSPKVVRMWTVQACTGYTLPPKFKPKAVHFNDGSVHWTRAFGGDLTRDTDSTFPDDANALDPPATFPTPAC